ncbi:DNA-directed RNA polymerase subunit beta' [Candidatus Gottesmanbacteria bacterium]|nr:DNA-directed RNA polymerase subunit beta' [Candidatus Gottesmanbacteria bacterium]
MASKSDILANVIDFKGLRISLASQEIIKGWSFGEILKPETINYRTLKPEKDGLFDERIFGPTKDWECYCGKYKRIRYKGIVCDKCGVEVTQSKVRRERMGHIALAAPVAHVWFFKGAPSKLSLLLNITPRNLESVIYFAQYVVLGIDEEERKKAVSFLEDEAKRKKMELEKTIISEKSEMSAKLKESKKELKKQIKNEEQRDMTFSELELATRQRVVATKSSIEDQKVQIEEIYQKLLEIVRGRKAFDVVTEDEYFKLKEYGVGEFMKLGMGAEAILAIIKNLDIDKLVVSQREEIKHSTGPKFVRVAKRLRLLEGIKRAKIKPEWMVLTVLPVIPPDLRPMVQLTGGRFATSDLNDLYRRVINRNNRLKHLINLGAPEIILRNEKRMLQEAVDALIDSTQRPSGRTAMAAQALKSLSDMLRGKQGRFRQNLLGKRVDYSGRSVIVVGPELSLHQCGLPKEMALEMFKPFVLKEIITKGLAPNVKSAKHLLERRTAEVWDILEEITKDHPVLLNRAPTLHKLGIQAFKPVLIEGNAIRIHPCVCAGYNADFDGDQMAVHIPLAKSACEEAVNLMLPKQNLLKPADGSPITVPNKDMALGCYYLTSLDIHGKKNEALTFSDEEEVVAAYQQDKIDIRQLIKVRIDGKIIETTVGRIFFNSLLPSSLRFINESIKAATIKNLITKALNLCSPDEVVKLIDDIKNIGFWGATISGGLSLSVFDNVMLPNKKELIKETEKKIAEIENNLAQGLITKEEQKRLNHELWIETTEKIADLTWENLPLDNPVRMIIHSGGARASKDQLKQLAAMRGLVVDPLGKIVEMPTKSNFREGLTIFEYVTSTRGSRKGLTDSALKTADAGYLTRRLVDVSHAEIIRIEDCGSLEGITISRKDPRQASFASRIIGRFVPKKIADPKTKKVIIKEDEEITEEKVELLEKAKIEEVVVRSPLTCQAKYGLCAKCYGRDFGQKKQVEIGTPVGVMAAQSIGEPGTQLTMRVKHAGGIVGLDVTQGLPRVEELFEVRTPKVLSPITEISGKVEVLETADGYKVRVKNTVTKPPEEREYVILLTSELKVKDGDLVSSGDQLASGYLDVKEVLKVRGLRGSQRYLIDEIQNVYESQGIPINDKHFEVIVKKMSDKVRIETSGDTILIPGEMVDKPLFDGENAKIMAEGGEPSTAQVVILGLTRAALFTASWLSAASFEQTTNVLTEASLQALEDPLIGLKENVIIGRLIPTNLERATII